jgi:hypothetical protein
MMPSGIESGIQGATLTIPPTVLSANVTGAVPLLNTGTAIGSASVSTPLLSSPLSGTVTLTGSTLSPIMTVTFPAPFSFALNGAISIANNSVTFSQVASAAGTTYVPDLPITEMDVTLNGTNGSVPALFDAPCTTTSGTLSATFTPWNGGTAVTSSPTLAVTGCTTTPPPPPPPTVGPPTVSGGSVTGLGKGKPSLAFTLTKGANATTGISSFMISLPSGLSFIKSKKLAKLISVSGAKVKSATASGSKLQVTLTSAVSSLHVKLSSKVLKVSTNLEKEIKQGKVKSLVATVTAAGKSTKLVFGKVS